MLVFSCLAGTYLCVKEADRQGIPTHKSLNTLLFVFVFSIIGARLYYVLQQYSFYIARPFEILAVWKGGFASFGGFIGGVLAGSLYLKKAQISVWKFADCCAPSIALGIFLTRIGCFMNGCCFGKITPLPWGVRFPRGSGAYIRQMLNGQITGSEAMSLSVHPTQLYHSLAGLCLFLLLLTLRKRKIFEGRLFLVFTVLYAILRFLIEFLRGDLIRGSVGIISLPQLLSVVIALIAGYFLVRKTRKSDAASLDSI